MPLYTFVYLWNILRTFEYISILLICPAYFLILFHTFSCFCLLLIDFFFLFCFIYPLQTFNLLVIIPYHTFQYFSFLLYFFAPFFILLLTFAYNLMYNFFLNNLSSFSIFLHSIGQLTHVMWCNTCNRNRTCPFTIVSTYCDCPDTVHLIYTTQQLWGPGAYFSCRTQFSTVSH